jgi:hypothetical protein
MPENQAREKRALYDHESAETPRRRPADDWGIDEDFPRVRGRRFARTPSGVAGKAARTHEGPPRSRRHRVEDWGADQAFEPPVQHDPEDLVQAAESARAQTEEFVSVDAPELEVTTEGRRTVRINGRPGERSEIAPFTSTARRRRPPRTVEERLAGNPTRIIAWAFLLGLLLILIAILTA